MLELQAEGEPEGAAPQDGSDSDESSSDEPEQPRGAGFAGFADMSDSEDDMALVDAEPEPAVAPPAPAPAPVPSSRKKKGKKASKAKDPGPCPLDVDDDAIAEALRLAGRPEDAEALLAQSRLDRALGEADAAATGGAVVELSPRNRAQELCCPPRSLDGLLLVRRAELEPDAEFVRLFGASSVEAARDERDADVAAGLARTAANPRRGGAVDTGPGDLSGLSRRQRRAVARAGRRDTGPRSGGVRARHAPGGPGAGASLAPSGARASRFALLGTDAFSVDGGLSDVPTPPTMAAGGLGMKLLPPAAPSGSASSDSALASALPEQSFALLQPAEYQALQRAFSTAGAQYDIDSVFRIASVAPHHVDSCLQVCEYFRSIGKLDDAGKALRRVLLALESAFHHVFKPWSHPCRLPFDVPENRCAHTALWRHAQLVGRGGAAVTAFSIARLLLSLDPVRDPMRSLLALDYYALRAGAIDAVVSLSQPPVAAGPAAAAGPRAAASAAGLLAWPQAIPRLHGWTVPGSAGAGIPSLALPGMAFSRGLALWRAGLAAGGLPVPGPLGGSAREVDVDTRALCAASEEQDEADIVEALELLGGAAGAAGGTGTRGRGRKGKGKKSQAPTADSDAPAAGPGGSWTGASLAMRLRRLARRAAVAAGLGIAQANEGSSAAGPDGLSGDATIAAVMAATAARYCVSEPASKAAFSLAAASSSGDTTARLYSDASAFTPLGGLARACLLHPAALPILLEELEITVASVGTGKFGADMRRTFGTEDHAAGLPVPRGVTVVTAAAEQAGAAVATSGTGGDAEPQSVVTSVHTVTWQGLGAPEVDSCRWAHVLAHPLFANAVADVEAADSGTPAPGSGASRSAVDTCLGRLCRIMATRQASLWKDSDALAVLHRAALAAAAAHDEALEEAPALASPPTGPAAAAAETSTSAGAVSGDGSGSSARAPACLWLQRPSPHRQALLEAAFGSPEHAMVCSALAEACRASWYARDGPAIKPSGPMPARGTPGAWRAMPPLGHYGAAVRAEFSDEYKQVSDEELRAAAGVDEPLGGAGAAPVPGGLGAGGRGAGGGGGDLADLAGQGAVVRLGGEGGLRVPVDELLAQAAALGMSPEEVLSGMQAAHASEGAGGSMPAAVAAGGGGGAGEPPQAISDATDPVTAFFQTMLPWYTAPEAAAGTGTAAAGGPAAATAAHATGSPPTGAGGPLMEPLSDAELAAQLQAAEDSGMFDDEDDADRHEDADTDDEQG